MENKLTFGVRLRELRKQTGITLRELADKVGTNFTYLNKIENGTLPPPSEKVIKLLAKALYADRDELLTLAGIIPEDIYEILKDSEVLKHLSKEQKSETPAVAKVNQNQNEHPSYQTNEARKSIEHKTDNMMFKRLTMPSFLTVLILVLIWFAAPVTETALSANNDGVVYNNQGEYEKALKFFNQALELDPEFALAYNNRGWAYLELGQFDKAIADCTKAIEIDSTLALAYSNRGLAHIRLGKHTQAIAECSKAIELDPSLALAYSNRGQAYINIGKYEEAIMDLDKAVELDPDLAGY